MNFYKSRRIMWIGFIIGIFTIALGPEFENTKITLVFMTVGSVLFFLSLVQAFVFYKCPYCGYSLMNVRGAVPEHCPKCGKELKSVIGVIDSTKK